MASKRRMRRSACGDKVGFVTSIDAINALHQLRRAGKTRGSSAVYRCQFCGKYHYGHQPAQNRRAMRLRRGF